MPELNQKNSNRTDAPLVVRIDKWLWAARFFKTRSQATHAVDLGRATINGDRVKPARNVALGDLIRIRAEHGDFEVEVMLLSDTRGPAPIAVTLYRETDESKLKREREQLARQLSGDEGYTGKGRPTKRDRRRIGGMGFGDS